MILIENEARDILNKNGICLIKKASMCNDRGAHNPNPDRVEYAAYKDGVMLYKFSTRTTLSPEEARTKTLGIEVLEKCLECASGEDYNNQGEMLYAAISRYLNPQSEMEAQEFEEICHDLKYFYVQNDLSTHLPSYKVNIELVEENRELLTKVIEELKALEASRLTQKQ